MTDYSYLDRTAGLERFLNPEPKSTFEAKSPLARAVDLAKEAFNPGHIEQVNAAPTPRPAPQTPFRDSFMGNLAAGFIPGVRGSFERQRGQEIIDAAGKMGVPPEVLQMMAADPRNADKYISPLMSYSMQQADPLHADAVTQARESRAGAEVRRRSAQQMLGGYDATLQGIEGTGKNPKSSASGKYQFLDGTWIDTVRRHAPELNQYSDQQILSLKNRDDAFKDRMYQAFTNDNRTTLTNALGREPTQGELYLAHQQGAGGALGLLMNPDQDAETLIGHDAFANNRGKPGQTAGQFAQQWTSRFDNTGGAGGGSDEQKLSPLQRMAFEIAAADPSQFDEAMKTMAKPGFGTSQDAIAVQYLIDQGKMTPEEGAQWLAGKVATGPNGELSYVTPQAVIGRGGGASPLQAAAQGADDMMLKQGTPQSAGVINIRAPQQVSKEEIEKIRKAEADSETLINALQGYASAFKKAGGMERGKSALDFSTNLNTKYNNAALLVKGDTLYNLGVLSGPDLEILQKTVADPSTFKGAVTDVDTVQEQVNTLIKQIRDGFTNKKKSMGLAPRDSGVNDLKERYGLDE